jgi:hypothetical protein
VKSDHVAVLQSRPVVKGKLRYEIKCSCGRRTAVGSRAQVQQDQKNHRKMAREKETHGTASA